MKRKFFIRNFVLIAMPAVLVTVLLGCMAVWMGYSNAVKEIRERQNQTVERIKSNVEVILSEADAQSLNYSVSPYIMVKLKALLENGYMEKENLDIAYMLKPFIDSNVNSKPYLHSVYIYLNNDNGNFFASGLGLANGLNYNDTGWIETVEREDPSKEQWLEERRISAYLKSSYMVDVISIYRRLYGSVYTRPIGTLVLNIRKEYLENLMEGYCSYDGQIIAILREDGEVLCQTGELPQNDKGFYVAEETSPGYSLVYVSYVPVGAGYQLSWKMLRLAGLFIMLASVLGMILAYLVTRRNARNVERVTSLFRLAEQGEKLPEIEKRPNDEYGYIIENVARNYVEKNYLQMQLAEKKHNLDRMYYSFLQSQLGPHFLFNTLKNIFWKSMAATGGPNDTSRMIDRLTNLLYYALVMPDKYVKVSEEIKMTRSYLEIQQMRFEYDFGTTWECDEQAERERTIKFVLQPLLDNSITHGIAGKGEKGRIEISVQKRNRLYFSVCDNGTGFTKESLERIREELKAETPPAGGSSLYNLNRRLTLTYGEESGLVIDSVSGEGSRVAFSIPLETEN